MSPNMLAAGLHGNGVFGRPDPAIGPARSGTSNSDMETTCSSSVTQRVLAHMHARRAPHQRARSFQLRFDRTRRRFSAFIYSPFPRLIDF